MKLPQHGSVIDPESGKVLWTWVNGDPSREVDLIPPIMMQADGALVSLALPHHVVVDLTEFSYEEMQEMVRDHAQVRVRVERGAVRVKKVHTVTNAEGKAVEVELDHPIEQVRQLRKDHAKKK